MAHPESQVRDNESLSQENIEKSTVHDLVYKYLRKCANKKQGNCACDKFNRQHTRRKDIHGRDISKIHMNSEKKVFNKRSRSQANKTILSKKVSKSSSRECVAAYTKAVYHGRKRAKLFVREALLYGLQSGLLTLINRRKNILRISQKLGRFSLKKMNEVTSEYSTQD